MHTNLRWYVDKSCQISSFCDKCRCYYEAWHIILRYYWWYQQVRFVFKVSNYKRILTTEWYFYCKNNLCVTKTVKIFWTEGESFSFCFCTQSIIFLFQIHKYLTMNSKPNLPMGLFFSLLVIVIFEKQLLHAAPSDSRANPRENSIEQGTSHVRRSFRTIRSTDENEPLENDVTLRIRDLPW